MVLMLEYRLKIRENHNNLKKIRRSKGLTQAGLADQCKVSMRYIQATEQFIRCPIVKVWRKIASALNVTLGDLLDE